MKLPTKLPHLVGALKLTAVPGQRLCIHCSAGFVMDVPGSELVFATFRAASDEEAAAIGPDASPEPFIHAWAEWRGAVWAPTAMDQMGGQLQPMNPAGYYAVNGATDFARLKRPDLLVVARLIGLSRHLRLGVPTRNGASVGMSLLDAVGKPYRIEGAAVLPPKGT